MYKYMESNQQKLFDFYLPFGGHLNADNRWAVLSNKIPWHELESEYGKHFSPDEGAPAKNIREASGALLIKEKLQVSDRELVEQVRENPYLQYFLGYERYSDEAPFSASLLPSFRARCSGVLLGKLNEILFREYQDDLKKKRRKTARKQKKMK